MRADNLLMKPLFLAVLAAAALTMPACGQNTGGTPAGAPAAAPGAPAAAPEGGAGPHGFAARLNLTPDQRQKIAPIMRSTMTQMRAINEDAHNREMAALSADHRAKVQQVIDQARASMPRMPIPPHGSNAAPNPGMGKFGAMRQQHEKLVSQIDSILSPSEKQSVIAIGNDAHSKMTALHTSVLNQVKPLLNADQAKMIEQMPMRGRFAMGANHTPDAGKYLMMGAMGHMRPEMHP